MKLIKRGVAISGLLLCLSGQADAMNFKGSFGLFGNFGYNTFSMYDVNQGFIHPLNTQAALMGLSGVVPDITDGWGGGGGWQYGVSENVLIGAEIEYLSAYSTSYYSAPGFRRKIDFFTTLYTYGGFIKMALPVNEKYCWTGTVGVSYLSQFGTDTGSGSGTYYNQEVKGSDIGFKFMVGGKYFLTENIGLGFDLGYRIAKINQVKDQFERNLYGANGESMTVDYSGFISRFAIDVFFNKSKVNENLNRFQPEQTQSTVEIQSTPVTPNLNSNANKEKGSEIGNEVTLSDKLRELKKLENDGIISQKEYDAKKQQLLNNY